MWEYTVTEFRYRDGDFLKFRDELNSYGKNGWKLISTEIIKDILDKKCIVCIFGRKVIIKDK